MVLKNMKNSEQAARKKNKATDPNYGQVESIKEGCYSDLPRKDKSNKKKSLAKGMGSERLDPKKKKKQSNSESKRKTCPSSSMTTESNSDSELLRDTRKRPKMFQKKRDRKLSCSEVQDCGAPANGFHVRKKCSKNSLEVEGHDEALMMKRKKKKKVKRKDNPCSLILHRGDHEEATKHISGKQKAACQKTLCFSQKKRRTRGQKAGGDSLLVKKKHLDSYMGKQEHHSGISEEGTASSVCKLQDAQSWDGHPQWQEDLACTSEKGCEAIKKKKKKKKKKMLLKKANTASLSSLAKNQENHGGVKSEYCLKHPSKKGLVVGKAPKETNKLTKKKREAGDVSCFSEGGQNATSKARVLGGKDKSKKTKKGKVGQDCMVRNDLARLEDSQERQIKKKRKNKEPQSSQDSDQEAGWKKAKTKKEQKETEDEIKLVAFKQGNCDEVNIDKVRRQALQEEIDRESGKTQIIKEEPDNRFGQWSTAAFETLEQKATFLRLLGGFKKGLASAQSSPAHVTKPNMALDRSREQKLQYNLQAEFEKAVTFKHHQGIGLGFQPTTPGYVDKYASKSIKFED